MIIIEIADTGTRFPTEEDDGRRWFIVDTNSETKAIRKVAKIIAEEEETTIAHAVEVLNTSDGYGMMYVHRPDEVFK